MFLELACEDFMPARTRLIGKNPMEVVAHLTHQRGGVPPHWHVQDGLGAVLRSGAVPKNVPVNGANPGTKKTFWDMYIYIYTYMLES